MLRQLLILIYSVTTAKAGYSKLKFANNYDLSKKSDCRLTPELSDVLVRLNVQSLITKSLNLENTHVYYNDKTVTLDAYVTKSKCTNNLFNLENNQQKGMIGELKKGLYQFESSSKLLPIPNYSFHFSAAISQDGESFGKTKYLMTTLAKINVNQNKSEQSLARKYCLFFSNNNLPILTCNKNKDSKIEKVEIETLGNQKVGLR